MEDDQTEDILSETEIDVCSVDIDDVELISQSLVPSPSSASCMGEISLKKMGKVNGIRKDSCSSPDADSGIDEKVTTTERGSKGSTATKSFNIKNVNEAGTEGLIMMETHKSLTDHDYPVAGPIKVKPQGMSQSSDMVVDSTTESVAPDNMETEDTTEDAVVSEAIAHTNEVTVQTEANFHYNEGHRSAASNQEDDTNPNNDQDGAITSQSAPLCNSAEGLRSQEQAPSSISNRFPYRHGCTSKKRARENRKRDWKAIEQASQPKSDSDEESQGLELDPLNRFYFESDHLALKHNQDYQRLLKTLVVLEGQRTQALRDLDELEKWREKALENPLEFVENLHDPGKVNFPQRQTIAKIPSVDWGRYLAQCTGSKVQFDMFVGTRGSLSKCIQSTEDEDFITASSKRANENLCDNDAGNKYVRGRLFLESKPATFNQLWTTEEQEKLEKLLHVFPPEDVESRRWEKIARALGNRTPKQVASRVQKYFIKLAKAGLPVPGRLPSLQKKAKVNPVSFRNSTFFPSWRPIMSMPDDDDDSAFDANELDSSESFSHISDPISDDDDIPSHLKETDEYKEYIKLVKLKRERECEINRSTDSVHHGFKCDKCGLEPIVGTRWHCMDCTVKDLDLCSSCVGRSVDAKGHVPEHNLKPFRHPETTFVDSDYVKLSEYKGRYNYLDPNFGPENTV